MGRPRNFDENAVLVKARDQFWLYGYASTSIQDLEKATGLQRSSIYQAFGDKKSLYERTLKHYKEQNSSYLKNLVSKSKSFDDFLQQLFEDALQRLTTGPTCKGCFMVNATTELAAVDEKIQAAVNQNRLHFVETLKPLALARKPAYRKPIEELCNYIFTLYSGINMLALSGASKTDLRSVIEFGLSAIKES